MAISAYSITLNHWAVSHIKGNWKFLSKLLTPEALTVIATKFLVQRCSVFVWWLYLLKLRHVIRWDKIFKIWLCSSLFNTGRLSLDLEDNLCWDSGGAIHLFWASFTSICRACIMISSLMLVAHVKINDVTNVKC